jgi:inosine-uridine nucleoside N-ribohydrolase
MTDFLRCELFFYIKQPSRYHSHSIFQFSLISDGSSSTETTHNLRNPLFISSYCSISPIMRYLTPFLLLCLVLSVNAHGRRYRNLPPLVILSDGNLDDTLATLHALADNNYRVTGICASGTGFSSAEGGAQTALRLIETVASSIEAEQPDKAHSLRNIIVSLGSSEPLSGSVNLETAILNVTAPPIRLLTDNLWFTRDAFFPSVGDLEVSQLDCTEMLQELSGTEHRKLSILATGTDTDLAIAYRSIPHLERKIRVIYRMGGAIKVHGNLFSYPPNTLSEFNIFLDPVASEEVLRNDRIRLIPLDASNDVPVTRDYVQAVAQINTLTANWWTAILGTVEGAFGSEIFFNDAMAPGGGYYWWDDLAYQVMLDVSCETNVRVPLSVDVSEGPNNPSGNLHLNYSILDIDDDDFEWVCYGLDAEDMTQKSLYWLENVAV